MLCSPDLHSCTHPSHTVSVQQHHQVSFHKHSFAICPVRAFSPLESTDLGTQKHFFPRAPQPPTGSPPGPSPRHGASASFRSFAQSTAGTSHTHSPAASDEVLGIYHHVIAG